MSNYVEITDSNGKTKRTRFLNPTQITCIDASGAEHCLLHFANGKSMELNLAAKKVIAILGGTPQETSSSSDHH